MDDDQWFCRFNLSQISDMSHERLINSAIHRKTNEFAKVYVVNGNDKFGLWFGNCITQLYSHYICVSSFLLIWNWEESNLCSSNSVSYSGFFLVSRYLDCIS